MNNELSLKKILEAHLFKNVAEIKFKQYVQINNLGDQYLYEKNRIYRNIRNSAITNGFHFSSNINLNYIILPLTQIDDILNKKSIPYFDNVSILKEYNDRYPEIILWDDIVDQIKKNNVFHETCHSVAYTEINNLNPIKPGDSQSQQQEILFMKIFEESFANCCELLAIIDTHDKYHRIFFEINSYICIFEEKNRLQQIEKQFGFKFLFKFTFFCYLFSNYLIDKISNSDFKKIVSFSVENDHQLGLALQQQKNLLGIFRIAQDLNPRFRQVTTRLYTKINRMKWPHAELINFDFLQHYERNLNLHQLLNTLAIVAVNNH